MHRPRSALAGVLLAALAPHAAAQSDDLICPGTQLTIVGADPAVAADLCGLAERTVAALGACHLVQSRPITIEVVEGIEHPFGTCLAAFDCDYDRVRLVIRDEYSGLIEADDPYAALPSAVLVETLLTHELTHALIWQTTDGGPVPLVDHEYIAAAMELEQMDPRWREAVLADAGLNGPALGRINIWIYRLEPRRFTANAWLHFHQPEAGCALIGELLAGTRSFDTLPP